MIRKTLQRTKQATFAIVIQKRGLFSLGTGFFVSRDGWFITAAHCVTDINKPVPEVPASESLTLEFENAREELSKRVNQIVSGLSAMGLKTLVLSTEELIELMYNSYNLNTASAIRIKSVEDLDILRS